MKVLQINSVCGTGSTGRIVLSIHNTIMESGHQSYVAYGRDYPNNCENVIRIGTKIDNYAHVVKTRFFDKHGFGSIQATKNFIDEIRVINPDIIHLHNIHGYYINVEILFKYLKEDNKKVVWTLHDCWSFTGHCTYFDFVGCEKWRETCVNCPQTKSYPKSVFLDNSIENFQAKRRIFNSLKQITLITPSHWLSKLVKKSFMSNFDVKIINNGIDLDVFRPKENDFKIKNNINDKFMILGVASVWEQRKGLKYFIELSSFLTSSEAIVLVGLTKSQIKQLPINIIGISKTDSIEDLVDIYSSANVFINPTLEDNFPTTNIESLACGTPVITFDTGGSGEALDKKTGIILKEKNAYKIYQEIQNVKNSSFISSKSCRDRALNFFDYKKSNQSIINLYENLMLKVQ